MRRTFLPLLFVPAVLALGVLYACSDDATSASPGSPDASPSSTSTSTSTATSTATNNPPTDSSVPDTGLDSGADTTQPFTPATLGNKLVLWLDADRNYDLIDGGVVWKDQSPEGNDAIQNTGARQPERFDGGTNDAGARGVVRFSGNQYLEIADDPTLQWADGDYAIYTVMRHTNQPEAGVSPYAIVYAKWIDTPPFTGPFIFANYPEDVLTGYVARVDDSREARTDGGLNDGTLRVVGARKVGLNLEIRINGAKQGEVDAGGFDASAFSAVGQKAFIGGRAAANFQALNGDIAELIAIKGNVSDADQAKIEAYLKARHGL